MARPLTFWPVKLRYLSDREFRQLARLVPDDEVHHRDNRETSLTEVTSSTYHQPLQLAGLLDELGRIPERTWNRWRVEDRARQGGVARAASANRDGSGRFVSDEPAGNGALANSGANQPEPATPAKPNRRSYERGEEEPTETRGSLREPTMRARGRARGMERLSDTPAFRNWNGERGR
jgi:hypothetical protein